MSYKKKQICLIIIEKYNNINLNIGYFFGLGSDEKIHNVFLRPKTGNDGKHFLHTTMSNHIWALLAPHSSNYEYLERACLSQTNDSTVLSEFNPWVTRILCSLIIM